MNQSLTLFFSRKNRKIRRAIRRAMNIDSSYNCDVPQTLNSKVREKLFRDLTPMRRQKSRNAIRLPVK